MEKIVAPLKMVVGIVTYHPSPQTCERIQGLFDRGIAFLVYDNTPGDNFWPAAIQPHVLRRGFNEGLGVALKKLGNCAYDQKYSHMLYFDQDVIFNSRSLDWITHWYEFHIPDKSVGLIWFNYQDQGSCSPEESKPYKIKLAISAGSLINLNALKSLEGHTDRWFLEGIDYDFCFRLVQQGYHLLGVNHCPDIDYLSNQPGIIHRDKFGKSHLLRIQPMMRLWNFWSALLNLSCRALLQGPREYAFIFFRNIFTYAYDQVKAIVWTFWIKVWKR